MYNAALCVFPVPCVIIIAWMTTRVRKVGSENGECEGGDTEELTLSEECKVEKPKNEKLGNEE